MARSPETGPAKRDSGRGFILELGLTAAFVGATAWGVAYYTGPNFKEEGKIVEQQEKILRELHDSGSVANRIHIPLIIPFPVMEQEIINPDDPKIKEYNVLEEELSNSLRTKRQQEGPILSRLNLLSVTLAPLLALGFLGRLLRYNKK